MFQTQNDLKGKGPENRLLSSEINPEKKKKPDMENYKDPRGP